MRHRCGGWPRLRARIERRQRAGVVGNWQMERRTVELRVGGQSYRVVSSAPESEVRKVAALVNAKVEQAGSSRNALFLAAMSLAGEALEERDRRLSLEKRTRDWLRRLLVRVENVLDRPAAGDSDCSPRE
jgi:cell division protein ZapA